MNPPRDIDGRIQWNRVNYWYLVQNVIGHRNHWPRYIVLKIFCGYLVERDLRVMWFYVG
jgi:hypothetical protein